MKKQYWVIVLIFLLIAGGVWFFTRDTTERDQLGDDRGPGQVEDEDRDNEVPNGEERLSLSNYILTEEGLRLNYAGEGYAHTSRAIWVSQKKENIVQHIEEFEATIMAKVYIVSDMDIILVHAVENANFEDDFIETDRRNRNKIIISSPIEVGSTWEDEDATYEIEAINDTVAVPYKTFNDVIKVRERIRDSESEIIKFYAPRYGLVKSVFVSGDLEIVVELESVEE